MPSKKDNRGVKSGQIRGEYKKRARLTEGVTINSLKNIEPIIEKNIEPIIEKNIEPIIEKNIEPIIEKNIEPIIVDPVNSQKPSGEKSFEDFVNKNKTIAEEKSELDIEYILAEPTPADSEITSDTNDMIFSGRLLLTFMDFVFPSVVLHLYKYKDRRVNKIKPAEICLSDEQIDQLEKTGIPDKMAQYIFALLPPWTLFALSYCIMIGTNIRAALDRLPSEEPGEAVEKKELTRKLKLTKNKKVG